MIFEVLQQVLNEFFVDVQEDNVSFYAGDLFEPSHFKLSDVFLQTSVINSLQLPFELSAGYLGNVTVEGLVGAVAGWPLEVSVSDLCLVLKPRKVQWENELLIRYARELLVAICQCLGRPAAVKKDSASYISPAKWIWSRIKAVGADMTVQLERIHFRVESPRSDNLVAYGLYIPLIRFAPREVEEQILYRRQQPGVVYPKASDNFFSKLLTIENSQFVGNPEEELGLKGRMCVGPIKIDCNEAAIRAAMGQTVADELQTSNTDVASATHFSVLQDAYHNFVRLVVHLPKRKGSRKRNPKDTSPRAKKRPGVSNVTDPVPPDQQKLERSARRTRMFHALLLRSSTFEVEVGTLEVNLSTYTSHIEKALRGQVPRRFEAIKPSETREEVNVKLPSMICRLQNRPAMNECVVDAAGARVIYRSTEQGRAAVIRHLAQLFKCKTGTITSIWPVVPPQLPYFYQHEFST
ncbi:hypothetical protein PInf_003664 [Phytophthora infestans]|nr:hypothetical protein PInf_003664 [Phytophthora infestans]